MMSQTIKRELVAAIRPRYTLGSRIERQLVLDDVGGRDRLPPQICYSGVESPTQTSHGPAARRPDQVHWAGAGGFGGGMAGGQLHLWQASGAWPADACGGAGAPR
jgi:hypothetical protein